MARLVVGKLASEAYREGGADPCEVDRPEHRSEEDAELVDLVRVRVGVRLGFGSQEDAELVHLVRVRVGVRARVRRRMPNL